jgi:hypothetical protein
MNAGWVGLHVKNIWVADVADSGASEANNRKCKRLINKWYIPALRSQTVLTEIRFRVFSRLIYQKKLYFHIKQTQ